MSLRVLAPGTHSLIVDAGRPSTRSLGIPSGGPADRRSLALGNALVGNPPFAPALEITLMGPTLLAEAEVGVCVYGAPFRIACDGKPIEPNTTFTLRNGQRLHVGGTPTGCRAYLCVPGGFREIPVLGSCTGLEPIRIGDVLNCGESHLPGRGLYLDPEPQCEGIRTVSGTQADWFDQAFFSQTYRVSPASNRMGVRFDGPSLALPKRELVSEPVAPGAIQITNDGRPIVLGVDGQTIGGYPKIAHVIAADLDVVGQLRPGAEVRFVRVSEEEAESAGTEQRATLRIWVRRIAIATA